jgi:hypothetical protein
MDLIKSLEEIFQKLDDSKLNRLVNSIYNNYSKDCAKINNEIFASIQEKYENGLNEQRDQMLKQLIQNRDKQLAKVNEIKEIMEPDPKKSLTQLKSLTAQIKSKQDEFACSLISVYDSILNRTKLESGLNLTKIIKYSLFIRKETTFKLENLKMLYNIDKLKDFYQISTDFLFVWFDTCKKRVIDDNMVILNRNGDVLKSRKLNSRYDIRVQGILFKFTATNIIACYEV